MIIRKGAVPMHISDGVINGSLCLASAGAAAVITTVALKKTSHDDIPRISVMTAAFFAASLIHIKIGPASTHLVLNGIAGIILGMAAFPSILIALIFQAVMFHHGGITTLGINAIIMGLPAIAASYIFRAGYKNKSTLIKKLTCFSAGTLAVLFSTVIMAACLVTSGAEFNRISQIAVAVQIPLALVEGIVTVMLVSFLERVKPDLLS